MFHSSGFDNEKLRKVYNDTDIRRVPLTGFVPGYHTLPFTLVGPNDLPSDQSTSGGKGSVKLSGNISVSPKLIFSFAKEEETYDKAFSEEEDFMDESLVGRIFSFGIANRKNLKIKNEHLTIEESQQTDEQLIAHVLDELSRKEIINMGVIWCPKPRFYPVSLERFILSIIGKELN